MATICAHRKCTMSFLLFTATHLASCDLSRRQESWRDPRDPAAAAQDTPWLGVAGPHCSLLTLKCGVTTRAE